MTARRSSRLGAKARRLTNRPGDDKHLASRGCPAGRLLVKNRVIAPPPRLMSVPRVQTGSAGLSNRRTRCYMTKTAPDLDPG